MRKRGFTLVELAIIIVIIGILAAVAVPAFVDLRGSARENAARAGLGTIRSAVSLQYANSIVTGGAPAWPASITAALFADGRVPTNPLSNSNTAEGACAVGVAWQYTQATGVVLACDEGGAALAW